MTTITVISFVPAAMAAGVARVEADRVLGPNPVCDQCRT